MRRLELIGMVLSVVTGVILSGLICERAHAGKVPEYIMYESRLVKDTADVRARGLKEEHTLRFTIFAEVQVEPEDGEPYVETVEILDEPQVKVVDTTDTDGYYCVFLGPIALDNVPLPCQSVYVLVEEEMRGGYVEIEEREIAPVIYAMKASYAQEAGHAKEAEYAADGQFILPGTSPKIISEENYPITINAGESGELYLNKFSTGEVWIGADVVFTPDYVIFGGGTVKIDKPNEQLVLNGQTIAAGDVTNWNTMNWTELTGIPADIADGDQVGITTETDPVYTAAPASGIAAADITNWNTTNWAEVTGIPADIADGDQVGITTETDPVYSAAPASGITAGAIGNWNTAFAWGNHGTQGYLTAETDPVYSAAPASGITTANITNWNTVNWGELTGVPADIADGDDVNDADADPSNEIQSLGTSGNNITLSNGGGSVTAPYANNSDKVDGKHASELVGVFTASYDSGWFAVTTDSTYVKSHGLGTRPKIVQVFVAQNSDGSGWCIEGQLYQDNHPEGAHYVGCAMTALSASSVTISTYQFVAKFPYNQYIYSGYCRIIAAK